MKLIDSAFSSAVEFVQSHVVGRLVKLGQEPAAPTPASLSEKLVGLGLDAQRIWWGPMVLHPSKIEFIIDDIAKNPPKSVIEVGGGSSTAVLAALSQRYAFPVVTLENHAKSISYIQHLVEGLPAAHHLRVMHTGFRRRQFPSGRRYWWYDVDLQSLNTKFDYVLVDGPMSKLVGRNGAFPELEPFLAPDSRFYFDDFVRRHEKEAIEEWIREYPGYKFEVSPVTTRMARVAFLRG